MIVAKPVIEKQFWILQEDDKKIGNVEACNGGYQVKINNKVVQFKSIKMVEQRTNIHFEEPIKTTKRNEVKTIYGFPIVGKVYNPLWNINTKLPLYTKTTKSKSWFAAGWYLIKKGKTWTSVLCPKLILLQRYKYVGPFYSKEETENHEHH